MQKKLRKSSTDKAISGVCGGIADFFGISSFGVRLLFILFLPVNLIVYIILANTIPDSPPSL
ncbi:PspC domain-containing protein [Virgibacillus profundi]|uniref:PspC domain-containing protein n=1 Tax=Virgibacillus profundi TaxID=2024555 RepID=A0A2A2IEC2_9BACI|nr:PspC domain-containing protein [Virgibacillus profundi]PAV29604.1 PspC domain-containing protein [Virgibacillus profundi]PXY53776.1 PspC domain-containing protein [Virgibacillus profundi]